MWVSENIWWFSAFSIYSWWSVPGGLQAETSRHKIKWRLCRFSASADSEDSNWVWSLLHLLIPHPVTFRNQPMLSADRLLGNGSSYERCCEDKGSMKHWTSFRATEQTLLQSSKELSEKHNCSNSSLFWPSSSSVRKVARKRRTVAVGSPCKALTGESVCRSRAGSSESELWQWSCGSDKRARKSIS